MCLYYRKNPRKEFHLSIQYKYQTIVVPFLYGQIYPREVTSLWDYDGPLAQLYPGTGQTLPQTMG